MKEVLKVEGMSCNHCVNTIETNVGGIMGVSAVKVDLNNDEVSVEYNNEETLAKVKETIEDKGFDLA